MPRLSQGLSPCIILCCVICHGTILPPLSEGLLIISQLWLKSDRDVFCAALSFWYLVWAKCSLSISSIIRCRKAHTLALVCKAAKRLRVYMCKFWGCMVPVPLTQQAQETQGLNKNLPRLFSNWIKSLRTWKSLSEFLPFSRLIAILSKIIWKKTALAHHLKGNTNSN